MELEAEDRDGVGDVGDWQVSVMFPLSTLRDLVCFALVRALFCFSYGSLRCVV